MKKSELKQIIKEEILKEKPVQWGLVQVGINPVKDFEYFLFKKKIKIKKISNNEFLIDINGGHDIIIKIMGYKK